MSILAIGDTHFPFVDQKSLDKVIDYIRIIQPEHVVQMGDLMDQYSFSSHHPTSRNVLTPKEEIISGRAMAEAMWLAIQSVSPESQCHQILGNHDLRIAKNIREKAPELECLLDYLDINSLWRFDDVTTVFDYREPLEIDGIVLHHGFGKFGSHMRKFLKPTIIGHLHTGNVEFMNLWDTTIWEMCAGFLGDRDSMAFHYTPLAARKWQSWTTGFSLWDALGPRFIPIKS